MTLQVVSIVAIVVGPVVAVLITIWLTRQTQKKDRQLEVFRKLMMTRRIPLSPEHVGALNLVEIEFHGVEKVLTPYKALMTHFATEHARRPNETATNDDGETEARHKDDRFHARINEERAKLRTTMLHAIAQQLSYRIDQLDIFDGGYSPEGHAMIEWEQQMIRRFVVDLYTGRIALPVKVHSDTTQTEHQDS